MMHYKEKEQVIRISGKLPSETPLFRFAKVCDHFTSKIIRNQLVDVQAYMVVLQT